MPDRPFVEKLKSQELIMKIFRLLIHFLKISLSKHQRLNKFLTMNPKGTCFSLYPKAGGWMATRRRWQHFDKFK